MYGTIKTTQDEEILNINQNDLYFSDIFLLVLCLIFLLDRKDKMFKSYVKQKSGWEVIELSRKKRF